jgi:hypothetical protein
MGRLAMDDTLDLQGLWTVVLAMKLLVLAALAAVLAEKRRRLRRTLDQLARWEAKRERHRRFAADRRP